jgi:hypothetical protein
VLLSGSDSFLTTTMLLLLNDSDNYDCHNLIMIISVLLTDNDSRLPHCYNNICATTP